MTKLEKGIGEIGTGHPAIPESGAELNTPKKTKELSKKVVGIGAKGDSLPRNKRSQ